MSLSTKYRAIDLDAHTKHKLESGQYPVDYRLDLHGYTLNDAHETLQKTVEYAYNHGQRCLLVVTGKGQNSSPNQPTIRYCLFDWLAENYFHNYLISYCEAQPRDGGQGAFYLLIKRNTQIRKLQHQRHTTCTYTDEPEYKFE